jgi:transcription initiation factor TFIIIB Brf1 subunit/transcription initiation factor TFIIB
MPQHDFTLYDIYDEQSRRLTEQSKAVYAALNELLDETPGCTADLADVLPQANALVSEYITQMEESRRDMQYHSILGAAIIITLREQNVPIQIEEIATLIRDASENDGVTKSRVSSWKRKLDAHSGTLTHPTSPEYFVRRYATEIDLEEDVADLAAEIAEQTDNTSGFSPNVTAARAIWVACEELDSGVQQQTILDAADTTGPSIRNHIEEMKEQAAIV